MGIETQIFFFRIEKTLEFKETSLGLLLHLPCDPHIHYRMHVHIDMLQYIETLHIDKVLMMMKADKLGWAGPGAGQEQTMSRPGAGCI